MSEPDWLKKAREKGLDIKVGEPTRVSDTPLFLPPALSDKATEAVFQKRVIEHAQGRGWRVAHFRKVRVQRKNGSVYWETPVAADGKGFLDLELVRDRLLKFELKVGENKLTPEQMEWMAAYQKAGVECYCWRPEDWGRIVEILK